MIRYRGPGKKETNKQIYQASIKEKQFRVDEGETGQRGKQDSKHLILT